MFEWLKGRSGRSGLESLVGGPAYAAYRDMLALRSEPVAGVAQVETEATATGEPVTAVVYMAAGSDSEIDALDEAVDRLPEWQSGLDGEFTEAEADVVRRRLLEALEGIEGPGEFIYDCAGSLLKAKNGDDVDVYLVRGDRDKLEQFNNRVAAVGGVCGPIGVDGLAVAFDGMANLVAGTEEMQTEEDRLLGSSIKPGAADRLHEFARENLNSLSPDETQKRIFRLLKKKSRGNLKQREVDERVALTVADAIRHTRQEQAGMAEVRAAIDPLVRVGLGNIWLSQLESMSQAATEQRPVLVAILPKAKAGWSHDLSWDFLGGAWDGMTSGCGLLVPVVPLEASPPDVDGVQNAASGPCQEHCPFCDCDQPAEEAAPETDRDRWATNRNASPSKVRYRLRHKYGVRFEQLVGRGLPREKAQYIADRVRHLLRQGNDIVSAIELAETEWCVRAGDIDSVDLLNLRRVLGFTVPRLIQDGSTRDHAWFVCQVVHRFMEVGADPMYAMTAAGQLWDAKGTPQEAEVTQRLIGVRKEMLYQRFFDTLTEAPPGEPVTEVMSGAQWVARVAQQLCDETNPKQGRRFTQEEALAQAWTGWRSMAVSARLQVRSEHRLAELRKRRLCNCHACESADFESANQAAREDEALIFPPAPPEAEPATEPEKAFGPSTLAAPSVLGLLMALAANPSVGTFGFLQDFAAPPEPEPEPDDEVDEVREALAEVFAEMAPGEVQTPEGYRRLFVTGLVASGYGQDAEWIADRRMALIAAGVAPDVASKLVASELTVRQARRTREARTAEAVRYFTEETERGSYSRQQFIVPRATELYAEGKDRRDALEQARDEWDTTQADGPPSDGDVETREERIERCVREPGCPEPEWANEDGTTKVFALVDGGHVMVSDFPNRKVVCCDVVKKGVGEWAPLSANDPNWRLILGRSGLKPLADAGFPFMSEFLAAYGAQGDTRFGVPPPGWGKKNSPEPYNESDLPDVAALMRKEFPEDYWVWQHFDPVRVSYLLTGLRYQRDLQHLPLAREAFLHICAAADIGPPPEASPGQSDDYTAWLVRVIARKKVLSRLNPAAGYV